MKFRFTLIFIALIVLMAACGGESSTPPKPSTKKQDISSAYPEPVLPTDTSSAYPQPIQGIPTQIPAYPGPDTTVTDKPISPASGYEPQPGDANLKRSTVSMELENSQVVSSGNRQVVAILKGDLPDPCHKLRVEVTPPDKNNIINLNVYSVMDTAVGCVTVIKPFTADIPLGDYPTGQYTVLVNGEPLGGFGSGYTPQVSDRQLERGEVFVDMGASQLLIMESLPIQAVANLVGNLPTPCHQLRVVVPDPDEKNVIDLEVYSVADPSASCTTVLQPFEANIPLNSYSAGHYTVFVNGEMLGEFDL